MPAPVRVRLSADRVTAIKLKIVFLLNICCLDFEQKSPILRWTINNRMPVKIDLILQKHRIQAL